jgi:hypothetical protein
VLAAAGVGIAGAAALPLVGLGQWTVSTTMLVTAPPGAQAPESDHHFTTKVTDDVTVEFLGVSPYPADAQSWFTIAGEPIDLPEPRLLEGEVNTGTPPEHQLAIRVAKPKTAIALLEIENTQLNSHAHMHADDDYLLLCRFTLAEPADTVSIRLGISTKDWQTIAASEDMKEPVQVTTEKHG